VNQRRETLLPKRAFDAGFSTPAADYCAGRRSPNGALTETRRVSVQSIVATLAQFLRINVASISCFEPLFSLSW
jgi:hypothetical protein